MTTRIPLAQPFAGLALAAALALAPAVAAQTTAATFNASQAINNESDVTYGWRFTTAAPIMVTRLGVWDVLGDGFSTAHPVTIWPTAGGAAVASLTVSGGTFVPSGPSGSGFRFASLATPVVLPAGDYVVGAYLPNTSDPYAVVDPTQSAFAPGITFVEGRRGSGNAFPALNSLTPNFGGDFQFTAVPEPAALTLCSVAAVGGIGGWLRRRRAAA